MSTASERIAHLVRDGKLSREEAVGLLDAVQVSPKRTGWALALNPFERIGGVTALAIGLALAALSMVSARLGERFNGYLDMHSTTNAVPWTLAAIDQLAAWIVPSIVMWLVGLAIVRRGRLIDMVGAVGLARLPYALIGAPLRLLSGPPAEYHEGVASVFTARLAAVLVVAIAILVWNGTWQFLAFRNVTGATGKRLGLGFLVAFVAAEVASKLVLVAFGFE